MDIGESKIMTNLKKMNRFNKRGMSHAVKDELITYIEDHPMLVGLTGETFQLWEKAAATLNTTGYKKSPMQWRKSWQDIRRKTLIKMNIINKKHAGKRIPASCQLTESQKRIRVLLKPALIRAHIEEDRPHVVADAINVDNPSDVSSDEDTLMESPVSSPVPNQPVRELSKIHKPYKTNKSNIPLANSSIAEPTPRRDRLRNNHIESLLETLKRNTNSLTVTKESLIVATDSKSESTEDLTVIKDSFKLVMEQMKVTIDQNQVIMKELKEIKKKL